jgi:predicted anti-sigma-YlaC factor YlaD
MSGWRRTAACDRASRLISLELDGELGRRERAVLARHLARCLDCAQLKETTGTITTILRLAPPERPSRPVVVPERAIPLRQRASLGAAATVALAAVAAIAAAAISLHGHSHASTSWSAVTLAENARLVDAQLIPPQSLPPLSAGWTTTPLPAQPFPACSLGCWPPTTGV